MSRYKIRAATPKTIAVPNAIKGSIRNNPKLIRAKSERSVARVTRVPTIPSDIVFTPARIA
jgi:hypothetical protein